MAKTNASRGKTRQSRRLNPDVTEQEQTATSEDQAKDEPKDRTPLVEDKPQYEGMLNTLPRKRDHVFAEKLLEVPISEAKNESEPIDQQEAGDADNQAENAASGSKTEEESETQVTSDAKGESDFTELELKTGDVQEDQPEVTSLDGLPNTEVPLKEEENGGDAEVDADIEVKGNAPTVSVSWETNEQQDQEMTSAEALTKTDCIEISDGEEKPSPPDVVVVEESEDAHAEVKAEMEETKDKDAGETENGGDAEMEAAACEENECVPPETTQEGANDGGKTIKRKQKAKPSVESSPSKKTKLINDGYCVYFGNLNNSKFYEDIKNTLASYLMTQSLLVQDIRLDKAKKHAFVDLASEMDLNKALTLNGEKLLDKPMKVSKAKVKNADKVKVKDPQRAKQAKNERSVFVENIPFCATREDVLKVFQKATAVRFLGGTESPSKGIAFVEFQNKELANAALKLSGKAKIQERVLRVNWVKDKSEEGKTKSNSNKNTNDSPSDTLFVRNLPDRVQEKHLKNIFKNAVQISIPQSDGKSRGYAFVQFESVAEAKTALNSAQNSKILNRQIKVQFGFKSKTGETKVSSKTLIVLGLNQNTTVNILKEAFEGALSSRIFVDKDTGRKFGFVDFESPESCKMAKESAEDVEIDGCKVAVAFARPKYSEGVDGGEKGHNIGEKAKKRGKGRGAVRPLLKKKKKKARR